MCMKTGRGGGEDISPETGRRGNGRENTNGSTSSWSSLRACRDDTSPCKQPVDEYSKSHSKAFLRSKEAIRAQEILYMAMDTRKGIRWLHEELYRLLSDLSSSIFPAASHDLIRCSVRGDFSRSEQALQKTKTSLWQEMLRDARALHNLAHDVVARIGLKSHVKQHLRFAVTQQTFKECLRTHTRPQLLRAWARFSQALFAIPPAALQRRKILRQAQRLLTSSCIIRLQSRLQRVRERNRGFAAGSLSPRQECDAHWLSVGGEGGGDASRKAVMLIEHWQQQGMFARWRDVQQEGERRKRYDDAVECVTSSWALKLTLARVIFGWRQWIHCVQRPFMIAGNIFKE